MKICDILHQREKGLSFEFFPPKTSPGMGSLIRTASFLKKYNPLYMSMTYGAGGGAQGRTKEAVRLLLKEGGVEIMPHLTCVGLGTAQLEAILDDYASWGIENIMALRGDPPAGAVDFDFARQEFPYGADLVAAVKKDGRFCVGAAVYPEGHIESATLREDLEYAKKKIDAGVSFAVTQMFFDNTHYYRLIDRMKRAGISIPVIPGILPLTDVGKVKKFSSVCRTTIPSSIEEKMSRYRDCPQEMAKIGIEFTVTQCRDLIAHGVGRLHFFTLNNLAVISSVCDPLF